MIFLPLLLAFFSSSVISVRSWTRQIDLDNSECNRTKWCMMRPRGCHPDRDCTQGYMMSVVGNNQLKVEMFAQSLVPAVPLQYLAIGFSTDKIMGGDMVSECVVSETGVEGGEVFLSFNRGKSNDRVHFDDLEAEVVYSDIRSSVVNGRISCTFIQSIRPQLDSSHGGRIMDLDHEYYIFGATGSAQPDEVNPHDLNRDSFYFPLISEETVNPSLVGNTPFVHPDSSLTRITTRKQQQQSPSITSPRPPVAASSIILSLLTLLLPLTYFIF
ncbi:hypothetical protein PRIPAC_82211 [Pristionchus pacificus]|nr:hypothetical protein PRIPAC_82211 [Pristionchus pacificus]